jgi:predicted AAA+ superfamily ATPase
MYKRHLSPGLKAALLDTPVVLLAGARQTGKTTLAQSLLGAKTGYLTLDDATTLAAASRDPQSFLDGLSGPVIIDEVQKAPGLFPAIKLLVDRDRRPGRFLLTGSANVLLMPKASESLAGRMEIFNLGPLSQGEISGKQERFIDHLFAGRGWPAMSGSLSKAALAGSIVRGGYPEAVSRSAQRREAWFDAYLSAILQRDIRDLSNIEGLVAGPRLLGLLAGRAGGLLNVSELSRTAGMPLTNLQRYLALFEAVFLIQRVPAWSSNHGKRMTKAPKLLMADSGLMARLLRVDEARLLDDPNFSGRLLEDFVGVELLKQASWHRHKPSLLHYRTAAGREVDFVLEEGGGKLAGVEVKSAASVSVGDFAGLKSLAEDAGKSFAGGVVLYRGGEVLPFGPGLWAVPIQSLWAEL